MCVCVCVEGLYVFVCFSVCVQRHSLSPPCLSISWCQSGMLESVYVCGEERGLLVICV